MRKTGMTQSPRQLFGAVLFSLALATAGAEDAPMLALKQARETALTNHPQICVADLRALAARQVTREFQSAFFPNLSANVVAVGAADRLLDDLIDNAQFDNVLRRRF